MLIETLLPLVKKSTRQGRTPGSEARPLFGGYLFANFSVATSLGSVTLSRGALGVVSKNGAPVPVDEAIILSLRQRVRPDGFIELCESSTTRRNGLQSASDPMQPWLNVFQTQLSDDRRVEVLIRILQDYHANSNHPCNMPAVSN